MAANARPRPVRGGSAEGGGIGREDQGPRHEAEGYLRAKRVFSGRMLPFGTLILEGSVNQLTSKSFDGMPVICQTDRERQWGRQEHRARTTNSLRKASSEV